MSTFRPHLSEQDFLQQVQRQQHAGYRLAYVENAGEVAAVAGFRVGESLAWGRFLYVDDLVTAPGQRSQGNGKQLFAWLLSQARDNACGQLHLDSGVHRFAAHKFYLREGLAISSHHFAMMVDELFVNPVEWWDSHWIEDNITKKLALLK